MDRYRYALALSIYIHRFSHFYSRTKIAMAKERTMANLFQIVWPTSRIIAERKLDVSHLTRVYTNSLKMRDCEKHGEREREKHGERESMVKYTFWWFISCLWYVLHNWFTQSVFERWFNLPLPHVPESDRRRWRRYDQPIITRANIKSMEMYINSTRNWCNTPHNSFGIVN